MFSSRWTASFWDTLSAPVSGAVTGTVSSTKWLLSQLKQEITPKTTAEYSNPKKTSQTSKALSKEEIEELERQEELERIAREEQEEKIRIENKIKKQKENEQIKRELQHLNLPPMAQLYADFDVIEKNDVHCFHQIYMVTKDGKQYFYKQNPENCIMSELEAYCRAVVDLIAHGHVPASAIPVYDNKGQFIGLCSEAIPNFKSVIKAPYTSKDFKVSILDNKIMTLTMLKKLDRWAELNNINLEDIAKRKAMSVDEWDELEDLEEISDREIRDLKNDIRKHYSWLNNREYKTDKRVEIYSLVEKIASDLINFRNAKGFAITFTSRLEIHDEDDLHRNNIGSGQMSSYTSETGASNSTPNTRKIVSIDFDMSKWKDLYPHKKTGIVDNYTRDPSSSGFIFRVPTGRFVKTGNDISRLPHTEDVSAFYRPTTGIPTVSEFVKEWINWGFSCIGVKDFDIVTYVSNNAYREEDKKAFASLTLNPVFIHYKFKTLLKYILTNIKAYEHLSSLCIREDVTHEGRSLREILKVSENENMEALRTQLYSMGYDLQLAHLSGPANSQVNPKRLYLYLDTYGIVTMKALNARGIIDTIPLSKNDLGEHYDSIRCTLADKDSTALHPDDFEVLAAISAKRGYAQNNTMYDFKQFLRDYGNEVKEEILEEFAELNTVYNTELFDLDAVRKECDVCIQLADTECVAKHSSAEIHEALNFSRMSL